MAVWPAQARGGAGVHWTRQVIVVALVGVLAAGAVTDAVACSCAADDLGFLAGAQVEIPANARGLLWAGRLGTPDGLLALPPGGSIRVELLAGGAWRVVPHRSHFIGDGVGGPGFYETILVGPADGVLPGARYRFVAFARPGHMLVPAGEDAPVDSQIVVVTVSEGEFTGASLTRGAAAATSGVLTLAANVQCAVAVPARWVDIPRVLPPEFAPWQDAFFYRTRVGDRLWRPTSNLCDRVPPGRSWRGHAADRLYHVPDPAGAPARLVDPGLPESADSARIEAWLPGTGQRFIATIYFSLRDR